MSQETSPAGSRGPRSVQAWLLVLVGLIAGVAGERLIVPSKSKTEVDRTEPAAQAPFSRIGNRIVVPPGSLLRSQLVVEGAATKEMARELVLPAVVEADPARTVNVMPPVTGVVVDLMAQLGGRVV
jgi:membrane fusion protein, heavy metal efflux system